MIVLQLDITKLLPSLVRRMRKSNHLEYTVEMGYDRGSFLFFDGVRYECEQFHFHTPAEHLIDGITYPMEIHLGHSNTVSTKSNHYLVIPYYSEWVSAMNFYKNSLARFLKQFGK